MHGRFLRGDVLFHRDDELHFAFLNRKIVQFRHLLRSVGLRESPIFHPAILPTEFSIIQAAAPPRLLAKPHSPVSGREYLRSSRTPATLLRASSSNTTAPAAPDTPAAPAQSVCGPRRPRNSPAACGPARPSRLPPRRSGIVSAPASGRRGPTTSTPHPPRQTCEWSRPCLPTPDPQIPSIRSDAPGNRQSPSPPAARQSTKTPPRAPPRARIPPR